MSEASYARQHLATYAAGLINAAGTTAVSFGCQLTRIGAGHFALLLDANSGLVDDETFTRVTPKVASCCVVAVEDLTNVEKRIRCLDRVGSVVATDIEASVYRSVTKRR